MIEREGVCEYVRERESETAENERSSYLCFVSKNRPHPQLYMDPSDIISVECNKWLLLLECFYRPEYLEHFLKPIQTCSHLLSTTAPARLVKTGFEENILIQA